MLEDEILQVADSDAVLNNGEVQVDENENESELNLTV